MSNKSVKNFRQTLVKANGDKVKMKKAFKNITSYLSSSITEKRKNPRITKIREWSGTILVNNEYQLVNF